ncbi:dynein heavy chain, partial [Spiromyces aspiralis]
TREGSKLVTLDGKLVVPEGTLFQQFLEWCHKLPDREPPTWLGLPSNAENLLLTQRGNMLVQKILQLKALNDDVDEIAYDPTATAEFDQRSDEPKAAGAEKAELPTYMRQIHVMCTTWLNMLPTELPELHGLSGLPSASAANTNDPISRVFEREYTITRSLLATVRDDLAQVQRVCRNEQKQTNHLRSLLTHLNAGKIPPSWLETYTVPKDFTIAKWVMDFADRLDQIQRVTNQVTPGVSAKDVIRREGIWLGGLVFPEAFITATRQEAAKSLGTSLEELELAVKFAPLNGDGAGGNEFSLCRLRLEGARLRPGSEGEIIPLSEGGGEKLDAITLYWDRMPGSNAINGSLITLPVYLNSDRKDLLFSARVPVFAADAATPTSLVCKEATQRAIAIVAA